MIPLPDPKRCALTNILRKPGQNGHHQFTEVERALIDMAQSKDRPAQNEAAIPEPDDVAELSERLAQAQDRAFVETGSIRDLRERETLILGGKAAQYAQCPFQGGDALLRAAITVIEVLVPGHDYVTASP